MRRKATLAEVTALQSRRTLLTRYIELATADGTMGTVRLYTRELGRVNVRLAELELQCEPKAPKTKTPCAWAKQIRTFFAVAIERGLNTKDDAGMRRAFENFLVRPVASREELDGRDWAELTAAVNRKRLAW